MDGLRLRSASGDAHRGGTPLPQRVGRKPQAFRRLSYGFTLTHESFRTWVGAPNVVWQERLRLPPYTLGDDKAALWALVEQVRARLATLRLCLHPHKVQITPVARGIDLLGYHLWPYRRRLRNDNGHRFARRLRGLAEAYARGEVDFAAINPGVQSWLGHARHGETEGLRRAILGPVVFRRSLGSIGRLRHDLSRGLEYDGGFHE